ncbi:MAG TPA: hypothetical protein EYP65_02235, partial [Armatimonadetes bacterium]|nr:hypothetical protein [Armatimonadota bacterium]
MVALASILIQSLGPNLLENPGFEEVGPKGLPAGWLLYGGSKVCTVRVVEEAHSGGRAVKLVDKGPRERNYRYSVGLYQI